MAATLAGAVPAMIVGATGGRFTTMIVAFLVALVVVAPYGWKRLWPIVRERRAARGPRSTSRGEVAAPETPPSPSEASTIVARVDAAATEWPDGAEVVDLEVPATITVGGRPSPLGRRLVEDAARRTGMSVEWVGATGVDGTADPVVLRLRRR